MYRRKPRSGTGPRSAMQNAILATCDGDYRQATSDRMIPASSHETYGTSVARNVLDSISKRERVFQVLQRNRTRGRGACCRGSVRKFTHHASHSHH